MEQNKPGTVDEYIAQFPPEVRSLLGQLRRAVKEAVPDAREKISYRMPAFELNGILVYFAAFQNHIGFYPTASGIEAFKEELADYKSSKGAVRFPIGRALPGAGEENRRVPGGGKQEPDGRRLSDGNNRFRRGSGKTKTA